MVIHSEQPLSTLTFLFTDLESSTRLWEQFPQAMKAALERHDALLRAAVEANVRWSMQQLLALPEAKRVLQEKSVALLGAVYELNTGRVRFLD